MCCISKYGSFFLQICIERFAHDFKVVSLKNNCQMKYAIKSSVIAFIGAFKFGLGGVRGRYMKCLTLKFTHRFNEMEYVF